MQRKIKLLPQVSFSILLSLSLKPRHGYEIMQQVHADSDGKIALGPGTLYGAIKQLLSDKLIQELKMDSADRRRYYQLTDHGKERLQRELDYFETALKLARQRDVYADGSQNRGEFHEAL